MSDISVELYLIVIVSTVRLALNVSDNRRSQKDEWQMADQVFLGLEDFDGDMQLTSVKVADVADRADFATWDAEMVTLRAQLLLWSAGRARIQGYRLVVNEQVPGAASSPIAQNAVQLILEMQDDTTQGIYIERIPAAALAKANDVGTNPAWIASGGLTIANPAHADYITLKAAIEASWESPNGNTGVLARAYIEE